MNAVVQFCEHDALTDVRALADQAFSRAAGAPLVEGNQVRLLKDARENYPAWLDPIGAAFTGRRMLGSVEARLMTSVGVLFLILVALFAFFPRVLTVPLLIIFAWLGGALLYINGQLEPWRLATLHCGSEFGAVAA